MKKILLYLVPGIFQMQHKKIFQGLIIFTSVFASILAIIKLEFFSSNSDNFKYQYTAYVFFTLGIITHFVTLIIKKTESNVLLLPDNLYEKGRLAFLKGNYELALLHFERLHKISNEDEDVIYQLGKIYIELNKTKKGILLYKDYLKRKNAKWKKEIELILEELGKNR